MLAKFITGILMLITGIVCFYFLYKPLKKEKSKRFFNGNFFLQLLSKIFILLGWIEILMFCFNIDGDFKTPQQTDDMTFINGIALLISIIAVSAWTEVFIKKLKVFRMNKKQ